MIKKKKNLVRSPDEYTRYYGNFRGVDFSSDHTQVNERRFAYSVNMYKDYRSGEGSAIETIPGFRRRFEAPSYTDNGQPLPTTIWGIHEFEYRKDGVNTERIVLVHAGHRLYCWTKYPLTANVKHKLTLVVPKDAFANGETTYSYILDELVETETINTVIGIEVNDNEYSNAAYYYYFEPAGILTINKEIEQILGENRTFNVLYNESTITDNDVLVTDMANTYSKSFVFNQKLYIIDGRSYYVFDPESMTAEKVEGYIPTVYKAIPADKELFTDEGIKKYEIEQKNLISDKFIHTYIADGSDEYLVYDNDISGIDSIYVYDKKLESGYTLDLNEGVIRFTEPPPAPTNLNRGEDDDGVKVIFVKSTETAEAHAKMINECTICAEFDKRIFLSGNYLHPNSIWYCGTRYDTGLEDATYWGELNEVVDGVENAPITGLIPVANTLAALKNHAKQDGSIYFHSRQANESVVLPVLYPNERGLSGYGCLGACVNFLDDPIFISRLGVDAIGQLSVRLERAVEHRSTLIDSKLVNLDLSNAKLAEWDGYLIVLVDGRIFMADSRQVYQGENGNLQYEWYYLEGIGVHEDQKKEYYFASNKPNGLPEVIEVDDNQYELVLAEKIYNAEYETYENLLHTSVKSLDLEAEPVPIVYSYTYTSIDTTDELGESAKNTIHYVLRETWDGKTYDGVTGFPKPTLKAILCEHRGSYIGGNFHAANVIENIEGNLFFGTTAGVVCSFNFDQRLKDGTFTSASYSFDNRTIYCGVATKMDNCDIPHLTKSTIKKSTVIKTKSLIASTAKVKIRTNKNGYKSIARLNSKAFSFEDVDFSDFTFATESQSIFAVKEKEKNWVEKQHWIYSDEYQRPLSLHYIAFRYKISGRIKE